MIKKCNLTSDRPWGGFTDSDCPETMGGRQVFHDYNLLRATDKVLRGHNPCMTQHFGVLTWSFQPQEEPQEGSSFHLPDK